MVGGDDQRGHGVARIGKAAVRLFFSSLPHPKSRRFLARAAGRDRTLAEIEMVLMCCTFLRACLDCDAGIQRWRYFGSFERFLYFSERSGTDNDNTVVHQQLLPFLLVIVIVLSIVHCYLNKWLRWCRSAAHGACCLFFTASLNAQRYTPRCQ